MKLLFLQIKKSEVSVSSDLEGIIFKYVDIGQIEGRFINRVRQLQNFYISSLHEILKINKFGVVIISGGPFFTFEIAVDIKNLIPCILDFRDPWIFDYRGFQHFFRLKNLLGKLVFLPSERRAVKAAVAVTTVTVGWVSLFQKFYPFEKEKFHLIENGYEDSVMPMIEKNNIRKSQDSLVLGVFGKLFYYTDFYSKIFLSALAGLDFTVDILQIGDREDNADYMLKEMGLSEDTIISTGFIEYVEGVSRLSSVDVCLIIDIRKSAIGTKIYDYIFLNKPIVYIGPKNTTIGNMVNNFEHGYVCSTSKEVTDALKEIIRLDEMKLTNSDNISNYSRRKQNEKWLDLIKSVAIDRK